MRFTQDTGSNGYFIHSVSDGGVTVQAPDGSATLLERSFILAAGELIRDWEPASLEQLLPAHFAPLIALRPEVLLLGTGPRLRFPATPLLAPLMAAGIGYEVMDSGAACRTYNLLNSEGRRAMAAILLP